MARQQNRKRPRADDLPQEHHPGKKIRSEGSFKRSSNFSPEFWDNLSKVWLTPRALRELDRRNDAQPTSKPPAPAVYTKDLARFARHGGPDLRHLRGYPEPRDHRLNMSSSRASDSSRYTISTKATSVSSKAKRSSAYDNDFEQHLIDHNVYLEGYEYTGDRQTPEPGNMDEVHLELLAGRASLSPSHFPEPVFRDFKRKNNTKSEGTIMRNVIPIITGNTSIPNEGNLRFTNFKSLTGGLTVNAVPDFFDGALPGDVDKSWRPISSWKPSLHREAQTLRDVRLAMMGHGARAMHALQNYDQEEPVYDGKAYTYSSTYHAGTGTLQLYAHHATAPADPEGRPEYHMTKLRGFDLTDSRDTFVQGATAFRNARDLAQRHRDQLIQGANARARRSDALSVGGQEVEAQQYVDAGSDEFVDCEDYVGSQVVAAENYATSHDINEGSAVPQYLYAEDGESPDSTSLGIMEPSMSFATSVTSSFSTQGHTRSKRNRASHSPPSNPQPHKKPGLAKTRHSAPRRSARSSAQASTSKLVTKQSAAAEGYWTWSDEHQSWYHLNEDGSRIWEDGTGD